MANALRYYRKPSAPPPDCLLEGAFVRVNIGPQQHPYFIHKKLLCHYSTYFEAAFNGSFKEGETQSATLDEETVEDFGRVYKWLYSGELVSEPATKGHSSQPLLVQVWLFGDRRGMPALQNSTLSAIYADINARWLVSRLDLVDVLFGEAPEQAGAKAFVVETFAVCFDGSGLAEDLEAVRPEVRADFTLRLAQRLYKDVGKDGVIRSDEGFKMITMCDFHEHQEKKCVQLAIDDEKMRNGEQVKIVK